MARVLEDILSKSLDMHQGPDNRSSGLSPYSWGIPSEKGYMISMAGAVKAGQPRGRSTQDALGESASPHPLTRIGERGHVNEISWKGCGDIRVEFHL